MTDFSFILSQNYQGKQWSMNGDSYEGLIWLDESEKPTQAQLDQEYIDYKNAYGYIADRKREYIARGATIEALIVAKIEADLEGRPDALNNLQAIRLQVKSEIPKPA